LLNHTPETLRLIMVDPKRVELVHFDGIPHLLGSVILEVPETVAALKWVTQEMERRYRLFAEAGARNLAAYNRRTLTTGENPLPFIVICIDEMAELMLTAPEEIERYICRIAQLARATGIHLVIATQRPSVDVITGLIKANFPARICFAVTSLIDSRVVLDTPGAERLLGKGDMLLMAPDSSKLVRAQGCFVSDGEIGALAAFWKDKETAYLDMLSERAPWADMAGEKADDLLEEAAKLVRTHQQASVSFLQRRLRIGYPRAARLMDDLEKRGVVGPQVSGGLTRAVRGEDVEG
jgi:S-DNA-T family DNA segregation ATPase FtsK/SpoIIIE